MNDNNGILLPEIRWPHCLLLLKLKIQQKLNWCYLSLVGCNIPWQRKRMTSEACFLDIYFTPWHDLTVLFHANWVSFNQCAQPAVIICQEAHFSNNIRATHDIACSLKFLGHFHHKSHVFADDLWNVAVLK